MAQLADVYMALSKSIDYTDKEIGCHNKHVAYIAGCIAQCMGLSSDEIKNTVIAGSLHDIGVLKEAEFKELADFQYGNGVDQHCEMGYRLINTCQLSQHLAQAIRYHHVDYIQWKENNAGGNIPMASHIIHVADRVDVLINRRKDFLLQKDDILATLKKYSGRRFDPEIVKCFEEVSAKESFWFDLQFDSIDEKIKSLIAYNPMLSLHDIHEISTLFTKIIDFRSRFTAAHSTSVANVARELGSLLNLSKRECLMLDIAGHLHDIGKLAIPLTILEKQGPLTKEEWTIMKQHVYFTYIILTVIDSADFRIINEWASYHHERQDGRGYPFKITKDKLTIGSRIMAVADMFTALAEERPYRSAMDDNEIMSAMNKAKKDLLDPLIVEAMLDNYLHFKELRAEAFRNSLKEFKEQFDF